MMKKHLIMMAATVILMVATVILMVACGKGGDKQETAENPETAVQEEMKTIHRLPDLHVKDTCRMGGSTYTWVIDRKASDSLGIVEDDMGFRYADNMVKIVVHRNGGLLYSGKFRKSDLAHQLSCDFLSKSILDGCCFLEVKDGIIIFSLAVSYPESDMSQPFKLHIDADGRSWVMKSNDLEEDYEPDSISTQGDNLISFVSDTNCLRGGNSIT